jgi:CBS domain-containing protein
MIIATVQEVLKGRDLPVTAPDVTVRAACHELDRLNVGALAVMDGERLVGVISERDVIRKCICRGRLTAETLVRDIMTPDPVTIPVGGSLPDALGMMERGGFRHLPVVDGERTVGLLSIRDIPTEYRLMFERFNEYRAAPAAARR